MEEISLLIQGQAFKIKKETLCEHSDYFRAMFSGNYVENNQTEISIDVLEPETVSIILQYMQIGLLNLYEYDLSAMLEIATAANFLQVTELMKQIQYMLESQMTESNWVDIMEFAECVSYPKLEHIAAVYGLLAFNKMKPEYIPSIHKLAWYMSNPYLYVENESDVFKFGFDWIINNETGADALLIVLSCLDLVKLTTYDLKRILELLGDYVNSLAIKVVQCLCVLHGNRGGISTTSLKNQRQKLIEEFTLRVWTETNKIVSESKARKLTYTPIIPMWQVEQSKPLPHCIYTYNDGVGLNKWMELKDSLLWGWNIITWGLTKVVMVCGEYDRGSGKFMRDVRVYDTLQNEWINHGVELPVRRHAGLAVVGDSLYIVGGVGGHRIVLNTAIVYDLKKRSYRNIEKIDETLQSPALCTFKNKVYVALNANICRHEDSDKDDKWVEVVTTKIRFSCMRPFKGYIYCIQGYFSHLYRFMPDVDERMEIITYFSNLPMTMCNIESIILNPVPRVSKTKYLGVTLDSRMTFNALEIRQCTCSLPLSDAMQDNEIFTERKGNRLLAFTQTLHGHADILFVEEYTGENTGNDSDETKEKPLVKPPLSCRAETEECPNTYRGESSFSSRFLKEYRVDFLADKPQIIYKLKALQGNIENKVIDAGSGVVLLSTPPLVKDISDYHKRYLSQYLN